VKPEVTLKLPLKLATQKPRAPSAPLLGKTQLAIIAPCHRVIGSSGKLTGFSGGLEVKDFLLELENGG